MWCRQIGRVVLRSLTYWIEVKESLNIGMPFVVIIRNPGRKGEGRSTHQKSFYSEIRPKSSTLQILTLIYSYKSTYICTYTYMTSIFTARISGALTNISLEDSTSFHACVIFPKIRLNAITSEADWEDNNWEEERIQRWKSCWWQHNY